jgi:hypothetical protein
MNTPMLPPPVEPIRWRDFKRFIADAEQLRDYKQLSRILHDLRFNSPNDDSLPASSDIEDEAEWCAELVAKVKAGFERFDSCRSI